MTTKTTTPMLSLTDVEARAAAARAQAAQELPPLQARRQALSLEALRTQGTPAELEIVEAEIHALATAAERAALAVQEAKARDEAAAQLAANAHRREQEAAFVALQAADADALRRVEAAVGDLVAAITACLASHRSLYAAAHDLDGPDQRRIAWNRKVILGRYILGALALLAPEVTHVRSEARIARLTPELAERNEA
jgi:hypothetical protein